VSIHIGGLNLGIPAVLAPMADTSDLPFRLVNRSCGCPLAFTEMINARSLSYGGKKVLKLLDTCPQDSPLGVQLLGREPEYIRKAVDVLNESGRYELLDLNAACPVRKVIRRGEGAALAKDIKLLGELVKVMVKHSQTPVSVKLRAGWDADNRNVCDAALAVQDAGAVCVFIHGRTCSQQYHGDVDYELIGAAKRRLSIPVFVSGNVFSAELAQDIIKKTACDGVVVARGSFGNPWIFSQIKALFSGEVLVEHRPDRAALVAMVRRHFDMLTDYDPRTGHVRFRKVFSWYIRYLPGARHFRDKIFRSRSQSEMAGLIDDFAGECA